MPVILQISDPLKPKSIPVGIDLGTTNSLVAWVDHCTPKSVGMRDGSPLFPSVVHYRPDGSVLLGREAQALASEHPKETIVSVKRFMGRGGDDPSIRRFAPYDFAPDGSTVRLRIFDRLLSPVEVSSEILIALKARAEEVLGATVSQAVITVPAYFDDAQRQATKDAGRLAGLEVLRLLNEPTAAAVAYGLDKKQNGTFAVFDLGGGTFDITILVLDDGVFQVKSTGGDSALGGDDLDRALVTGLLAKQRRDPEALSPTDKRRVLDEIKAARHRLTEVETTTLELLGQPVQLPRAEADAMMWPVVDRTTGPVRRALKDAGLSAGELDGVILVGGATRVPLVRRHVEALFGREPLTDLDPDQVVALGAAIQADQLAGTAQAGEILLLDVNPLSLGIEMMGGIVEKIIPRNSNIPTTATQEFTTYADNQTGFKIHVVQGERELVEDCRSLARFELRGIPPLPAGVARLEVQLAIDANGLLTVTARETTTGATQSVDVRPSYGLSDAEVERMLLDAFDHGEEDVKKRLVREMRVEAERILAATATALAKDGHLVEAEERMRIEAAAAELAAAHTGEDHNRIRLAIEALDLASRDFAGRIMNQSIGRALEGRSVDGVLGQ